ncbi:MAG: helix-turn-helix transcriptional regulator [Clostridiales bacterium]|nr:helix-turn-helix transcriptional regulator [Clostridiales bacterium]
MEFHERLKKLRTEKGFTQKQVAEKLGMAVRQYQRYEHGERKPTYDVIIELCGCFEISSDELLGLHSND